MRRVLAGSLVLVALAGAACRPGSPIVNTDPVRPTTAGNPLTERRVEAVDIATGQRYAAQTGVTGGYSIKVPPAKYRLEVELHENEAIVRQPGTIDINSSDLDPDMDIVVGAAR